MKLINNAVPSKNAVTLHWPEPTKRIERYIVKYRLKGSPDNDWVKNETNAFSIKITGLVNGKTYEFQVLYEKAGEEIKYTEVREVALPSVGKSCTLLYPTIVCVFSPRRKIAPTPPPKAKTPVEYMIIWNCKPKNEFLRQD